MNDKALNVYTEVWCVITYGDTEIDGVYLDKNKAVDVADENNERRKTLTFYDPKSPKCEVKSLADAIDWIKDAMEDQRKMDEYYKES